MTSHGRRFTSFMEKSRRGASTSDARAASSARRLAGEAERRPGKLGLTRGLIVIVAAGIS